MKKPMRKRKDKPEAMSRKDATKMRSMKTKPYQKMGEEMRSTNLYNKTKKENDSTNAYSKVKKKKLSSEYKSGGAKSSKVPNWAGGK